METTRINSHSWNFLFLDNYFSHWLLSVSSVTTCSSARVKSMFKPNRIVTCKRRRRTILHNGYSRNNLIVTVQSPVLSFSSNSFAYVYKVNKSLYINIRVYIFFCGGRRGLIIKSATAIKHFEFSSVFHLDNDARAHGVFVFLSNRPRFQYFVFVFFSLELAAVYILTDGI